MNYMCETFSYLYVTSFKNYPNKNLPCKVKNMTCKKIGYHKIYPFLILEDPR